MNLILNLTQFIIYSILIVLVTKNFLIKVLRRLASALDLDSKTVGNVSGVATSMPEVISVFFTALQGMFATGIFNILSSNIINFIQYIISIYQNRNQKALKNDALKSDIIMVIITILIPASIIIFNIEINIGFVPIFIMLFILFYIINANTHKLYLSNAKTKELKEFEEEKKWVRGKKNVIVKNIIYLIIIGIALFIIGELLGNVVRRLRVMFNIPQSVIGIALGFITSLPELITFIESQKNSKNNENEVEGVVEATNNLLTSNIINLFVVLTIGIIVTAII
ncbi:MAG: hypothetical protein HFJ19_04215 [Clostridia bacterium]|nr:hypothetical protein [Clostridia bacterium]